jgi:hypothetical protein
VVYLAQELLVCIVLTGVGCSSNEPIDQVGNRSVSLNKGGTTFTAVISYASEKIRIYTSCELLLFATVVITSYRYHENSPRTLNFRIIVQKEAHHNCMTSVHSFVSHCCSAISTVSFLNNTEILYRLTNPNSTTKHTRLAQLEERSTFNRVVVGSIPTSGAFFASQLRYYTAQQFMGIDYYYYHQTYFYSLIRTMEKLFFCQYDLIK